MDEDIEKWSLEEIDRYFHQITQWERFNEENNKRIKAEAQSAEDNSQTCIYF